MADNIISLTIGNSTSLVEGSLEVDNTTNALLAGSALTLDVAGAEVPILNLALTPGANGTTTITGATAVGTGVSLQYQGTLPSSVGVNVTALGQPAVQATVAATSAIVCFASGTLIRTARGDVAVEHLAVADLVVTASGKHRPISWLGHRTVDCARHPNPHDVRPVRISAHAFGENRPMRDLWVSRGHAICVDVVGEVLIPAGALINGTTVQQVEADTVTYWHVELENHDILLAENLPCESYADLGNRSFFADGTVVTLDALPDVLAEGRAGYCRPFHEDGLLVEAIRAQLQLRAASFGWTLEPATVEGVHLLTTDGRRLEATARGLDLRFSVPAQAGDLWLVSTTARPCDVEGATDRRELGLNLSGIAIYNGFDKRRTVDMDDPLFDAGFYAIEAAGLRWTNGHAKLPAALWQEEEDGFFLNITLARPALPRWVEPTPVAEDAPSKKSA